MMFLFLSLRSDSRNFSDLLTNGNYSDSLIFEENFENDPIWLGAYTQFPESHSFSLSSNPVFRGKFSGRFELRFGDKRATKTGIRSEIMVPASDQPEKWYSFAALFPSEGWEEDIDEELFTQWHTLGSPVLGFSVRNGSFRFSIGHGTRNSPQSKKYSFEKVTKDKWVEFVFHIIHSKGSDGLVEIWKDGNKILTHNGPNMYSDDTHYPHWKLGIYKWTWDKKETNVSKRITFFDNIKIGDEKASLQDFFNITIPEAPILGSPFDKSNEVISTPILQWKNRDATAIYHIQVSERADFGVLLLESNNVTGTSFKLPKLQSGKNYYWRVRAENKNGFSEWSTTWQFKTRQTSIGGLVAYWKMEEGDRDIIYDHSGNGFNAIIQNYRLNSPKWIQGISNKGIYLNGSWGETESISNLLLYDQLTIAAWVKPMDFGTRAFISRGNSDDGFFLRIEKEGRFEFRFRTSSRHTPYVLYSQQKYLADKETWTHLAITFNGTKAVIYINGKEDNAVSVPKSNIFNNESPIQIGAINGSNRWVGELDEVMIFDRVLKIDEIQNILKISD